jgi:hypothetical protein
LHFWIAPSVAICREMLTLLNGIRPDDMLEVDFDYLQFVI